MFVLVRPLPCVKQETKSHVVAGTTVDINSKGGSFNVTRGSSKIAVRLDFLKEYRNAGKEEVVKHSIENVTFTTLEERKNIPLLLMPGTRDSRCGKDYEVASAESVSSASGNKCIVNKELISPYSAFGSIISFFGKLDNGGKVTIDVMVVDSMGKVGTKEQSWWASSGDVKFNIELDDWHWSDECSDSLDLGICISRDNGEWVQKENDKYAYTLGETSQLHLASNYYTLDKTGETWQSKDLSVGYSKLNKDDEETVFTLRFGKFGAKIFYDTFIYLNPHEMTINKQSRPVTREMSNKHRSEIQSLLSYRSHEGYYPPVVISFATGFRETIDDEGAGPGLVYASKLIALFDKEGVKSYSILHSGNDDLGHNRLQLRLSTCTSKFEADKCKVFVTLLSPAYLQSIDCLDEFHMAIKRERENMCKIITIISEDISSETKDWWKELERYDVCEVYKIRRVNVTEYLEGKGCVRQGELVVENSDKVYELIKKVKLIGTLIVYRAQSKIFHILERKHLMTKYSLPFSFRIPSTLHAAIPVKSTQCTVMVGFNERSAVDDAMEVTKRLNTHISKL
jgi:hypothetical protein